MSIQIILSAGKIVNKEMKFRFGLCLLHTNGELNLYVSVLTPPIPQRVPYVAGGEIPIQLKSAKTKCAYTRISLDKKRYRNIIELCPRCSGWLSPGFTSIHAIP